MELRDLLDAHWAWVMAQAPVWATTLGDHRFDDRIDDNSTEAMASQRLARRAWLKKAEQLDAAALSPNDRVTLGLFKESLEADIASEVCAFEEWNISAMENPITRWNVLPRQHLIKSWADAENYLARVKAIARHIDNTTTALARGAKLGKYANAETARRVIAMVQGQLGEANHDWPLYEPGRADHLGWSAAQTQRFTSELGQSIEEGVRPALGRYARLLEEEILPHARDEAHSGVGAVPDGQACYQARIRAHVGLDKTAPQIHEIGRAEISRLDLEMEELGFELFQTRSLPAILAKLRTDKKLYFTTEDAVAEKATQALAAAKAKIPQYFSRLPHADCVVQRIPGYEAPYTSIAYYREPHPDGSKPGEYFVNTFAPETRPRYEAEALAFHESIPGHHLQIAIAQELPALPAFRKFTGSTAFVEGWALYSERLAAEMELYSGPLDRMGMLSYEAWRAARLVVDTGIHAMGWSREQAVTYMLEHTALAENNIRNEVDRYISWPGQALAYKIGQLEILRLRSLARRELGGHFDLKAFHEVVLGAGAVSLPILGERVTVWIVQRKAAGSSAGAAVP